MCGVPYECCVCMMMMMCLFVEGPEGRVEINVVLTVRGLEVGEHSAY